MNVSIVIVNWNSRELLRACLASLARQGPSAGTEVIVIDNGSFDGCAEMLARDFPAARFLQSPANLGFARANNLAARAARGRHLLFLNPDTVLREDTPAILSRQLDRLPDAGAIGGQLLNADLTLQTSCIQSFPTPFNQACDAQWLRRLFPRARAWGMAPLYSASREPSPVAAVCGACLAVDRAAFWQVGGFSESYFMYGEDLDLCRKLQATGRRVYYTPETAVIHLGGGSSGQAPGNFSILMMRDSVHRFIRTHDGPFAAAAYRVAMGLSAVTRLALLAPARVLGMVSPGAGSGRKWRAILGWSLGLTAARPAPPAAAAVS